MNPISPLPHPRHPQTAAELRGYYFGAIINHLRWLRITRAAFEMLKNYGHVDTKLLNHVWKTTIGVEENRIHAPTKINPSHREDLNESTRKEMWKGFADISHLCLFVGLPVNVRLTARELFEVTLRPYERMFFEDEKDDTVVGACVFLACQKHGAVPPPALVAEYYKEPMHLVVEKLEVLATLKSEDGHLQGDDELSKSMAALTIGKGKEPVRTSSPWTLNEETCEW
jgi:hypothetical protein